MKFHIITSLVFYITLAWLFGWQVALGAWVLVLCINAGLAAFALHWLRRRGLLPATVRKSGRSW